MDAGSAPQGLDGLLSEPRLARYLDRYRGDRKLALRLYTWNLAVSSAFWGPIGVLEVVVRNAIHQQLVARTDRDDWWKDPDLQLCRNETDSIHSAVSTLIRRGNPAPTSDQVVAATSFGLWTGLTGAGIARDPVLSYETSLWQPRLQHAFPNRGDKRRKYIHARLDEVRVLRNRIAHHEPIYRAPLEHLHEDILDIAGMIHPDARAYILEHSRAPEVIDQLQAAVTTGEIRF